MLRKYIIPQNCVYTVQYTYIWYIRSKTYTMRFVEHTQQDKYVHILEKHSCCKLAYFVPLCTADRICSFRLRHKISTGKFLLQMILSFLSDASQKHERDILKMRLSRDVGVILRFMFLLCCDRQIASCLLRRWNSVCVDYT